MISQFSLDIQKALDLHPGLSIHYEYNEPKYIFGIYRLKNQFGEALFEYTIKIIFDKLNYPNHFPVLVVEGNQIFPKTAERHISPDGIACLEIIQKIKLIEHSGITLVNFIKNYVHRYFCWQILYDHNYKDQLFFWPHSEHGTLSFYQEFFCIKDIRIITELLICYIINKQSKSYRCPCSNSMLFLKCHGLKDNYYSTQLAKIGSDQICLDIIDLLHLKLKNPFNL